MDLLKYLLSYLKRELILWVSEACKPSCIDMERCLQERDAEPETDNKNNTGTKTLCS